MAGAGTLAPLPVARGAGVLPAEEYWGKQRGAHRRGRVLGWVVGGWGTWRRGLVVRVAGGGSGQRRERPTAGSIGGCLPAARATSGGRRWSLCRLAVGGGGGRPQLLVGGGAGGGASGRRRLVSILPTASIDAIRIN